MLFRRARSRALFALVALRPLRELCDLPRLSCLRSRGGTRDRSRRYAGCGVPFREGPTSMRCRAVSHDQTYPTARAYCKTTWSNMTRRFSLALLTLMFSARALSAQMPRRPSGYTNNPDYWITAGVSGFRANVVNDGTSASTWNFGNSTNFAYRGSIEKGGNNGSSFAA